MKGKLIDTNILYDAWVENIHTEKALLVVNRRVYIFEGVLYELSNLLKNNIGTDYACAVINEILDNPEIFIILKVGKDLQKYAMEIMKKYQISKPKKRLFLGRCNPISISRI